MAFRDLMRWRGREVPVWRERPLFSLQHDMNRLFDDFFGGFDLEPLLAWGEPAYTFMPRIDVSEDDKAIRVVAELPGMDEKDIEVSLSDGSLAIKGEKKEEQKKEETDYRRVERTYGRFERLIPLPAAVDEEKIEAEFKNGLLTVVVPKAAEVKEAGRRIAIKAG